MMLDAGCLEALLSFRGFREEISIIGHLVRPIAIIYSENVFLYVFKNCAFISKLSFDFIVMVSERSIWQLYDPIHWHDDNIHRVEVLAVRYCFHVYIIITLRPSFNL